MRVLGLGGLARSGKDTVADHLVREYGWEKLEMGRFVMRALEVLNPYVAGPIRFDELMVLRGYERAKTEVPEVRRLLQAMGTEVGRGLLGEYVWVNLARAELERRADRGVEGVVVTGIRFANELAMCPESAWVDRPGLGVMDHVSEHSLSADDFDLVIPNRGDLEDLYRMVDLTLGIGS